MKIPSICFDRFRMSEFSIATADLCLTEDLSSYFRHTSGKKYFSYPHIMRVIDYLNSNRSAISSNADFSDAKYYYDIPTDKEFEQIIAKFAYRDGACHSFNLATALGLGFYGSIGIITTLEQYNKSPQDFIYSQALGYGVAGYYWCKGTGEHKGQASILCLNSCGEPTIIREIIDRGSHIGCSVRLIARPW